MKKAILLLLIFSPQLLAGYKITNDTKNVTAVRVSSPLRIDGMLNEELYRTKGTDDFTQREPDEGAKPTQRTEFWIGYDDNALYVGARLHDTQPDSIIGRLGRRDNIPKSDMFFVAIDSYFDRRTAFFFGINPVGSIVDGTFFNDSWDDDTWDGIWERAVSIDDKGWNVEMRIPYSQLRFSKKEEYVWGINVLREITRNNEEDFFVYVPKKESGFVSRFAHLRGIKNIEPHARFEIMPYSTAGFERTKNLDKGDPFNKAEKFTKSIGADFKIGIGSNLTLDATVNPDFGQVEVDPAEVNLSAFETYYDEKRPFFIEGSNIFYFGTGGANNNMSFNWSNPEFFYSRRIGRAPTKSISDYNNSPKNTTILGAAKISGKLNDEQSLGVIAAVTEREMADVDINGERSRVEVEPLTFWGVGRTQFEFNEGEYGLGYLFTAVERDTRDKELATLLYKRQYTLGSDGWFFLDKDQMWVITGWSGLSYTNATEERMLKFQKAPQRYYQRPDANYLSLDSNATSLTGYSGRVALNKQKGNWRFNSAFGLISPAFDVNDIGYQWRSDHINGHISVGYQWFDPDEIFRRKSVTAAAARSYNFGGDKTQELYFLFTNIQFLNYWGLNAQTFFAPRTTDIQRTRGGPKMIGPSTYNFNLSGYSDSRNPISISPYTGYNANEFGGYSRWYGLSISWKPLPSLTMSISPSYEFSQAVAQYLRHIYDENATATYGNRYIFGKLDWTTVSASVRLNWTFTPTLSLQLYMQPYFAIGEYSNIKELAKPNTFSFNNYGENGSTVNKDENGDFAIDPDGSGPLGLYTFNRGFNYKSLRGNAVLRWEYLPGSTIFFVWTQSREDNADPGSMNFGRDFSNLMNADVDNIFMIKATYWFSL